MTCRTCGRPAENGRPTHWLGCPETTKATLAKVVEADARKRAKDIEPEYSLEGCIKDGCTNPRAVSKGPRPTKYCDEHKTGSKK
jgi:hypothetical protein